MNHQSSKILTTVILILAVMSVLAVEAQSPQATLKQYISDLQKNPNDNALREKIIKLVQIIKPAPDRGLLPETFASAIF